MRQKLYRGRRNVFRKRNPALRIIGGIVAAVAVVAVGFFGAKWFNEHPLTEPGGTSQPTVSAPVSGPDTSAPTDVTPDTPDAPDVPTSTDALRGFYLPFSALTEDALSSTLTAAKAAGFNAVVFDLKDTEGRLYYRFSTAMAQQVNSYVDNALTEAQLKELFTAIRDAGLLPVPRLHAFRDNLGAKALPAARIAHQSNAGWVWYDGNPQSGGKAWLNPYTDEAHSYIIELASALKEAGAGGVMLDSVQFPSQTSSASFGSSSHITLKRDEILGLFVQRAREKLGEEYPLLLCCTAESALGTATQVYGGNPLTFGSTVASPLILPGSLPKSIKVGETTIQNTPETLQQTVQALVAQMALRIKVVAKAPTLTPFLQAEGYTAEQIRQEIAGCIAGGAESYILYHPNGQYDFSAMA